VYLGRKQRQPLGLLASNPARFVELPSGDKRHPMVWPRTRIALWQASGIRSAVGRRLTGLNVFALRVDPWTMARGEWRSR
jgi:hypothetical protein